MTAGLTREKRVWSLTSFCSPKMLVSQSFPSSGATFLPIATLKELRHRMFLFLICFSKLQSCSSVWTERQHTQGMPRKRLGISQIYDVPIRYLNWGQVQHIVISSREGGPLNLFSFGDPIFTRENGSSLLLTHCGVFAVKIRRAGKKINW